MRFFEKTSVVVVPSGKYGLGLGNGNNMPEIRRTINIQPGSDRSSRRNYSTRNTRIRNRNRSPKFVNRYKLFEKKPLYSKKELEQ